MADTIYPRKPPQMVDLVRELAAARTKLAELQARYRAECEAFEALQAPLVEAIRAVQAQTDRANDTVRSQALAVAERFAARNPAPGVQCVQQTVVDYQPADALAWAMRAGIALQLDDAVFRRIAKATPDSVPFARVYQAWAVRIATDLDAALRGPEAAAWAVGEAERIDAALAAIEGAAGDAEGGNGS